MDAATKSGAATAAAAEKGRRRRQHGSTALFVVVDYAFLLAFAGFLSYLLCLLALLFNCSSPAPHRSGSDTVIVNSDLRMHIVGARSDCFQASPVWRCDKTKAFR
ncbi:hypothetical protein ABZP36_010151 [Zizania latifolia]